MRIYNYRFKIINDLKLYLKILLVIVRLRAE